MRAFYAEPNPIKRDESVACQAHILENYQPQRSKKLRLADIKEMCADHSVRAIAVC
jgi:hypothetical protein